MKKLSTLLLVVCSFLFYNTTQAQTFFSGGIYANTTWTLANSPYIITDTVVVFPGDTLTIQPGVVVQCDTNVVIEIRQSVLIANGTAALPIVFKGNSVSAGISFWQGILLDQSDSCIFHYCTIKNAANGIHFPNYYPTIPPSFDHCIFNLNSYGIFSETYGSTFSFNNCTFSNNTYGIFEHGSCTYKMDSTNFFSNSTRAMFNPYDYFTVFIKHCNVIGGGIDIVLWNN